MSITQTFRCFNIFRLQVFIKIQVTYYYLHLLPASAMSVNEVKVDPVTSTWNLGIYIDVDQIMRNHVQQTYVQHSGTLHQLQKIRQLVLQILACSSYFLETRLRRWRTGRPACLSCTSTPGGTECVSIVDLASTSL